MAHILGQYNYNNNVLLLVSGPRLLPLDLVDGEGGPGPCLAGRGDAVAGLPVLPEPAGGRTCGVVDDTRFSSRNLCLCLHLLNSSPLVLRCVSAVTFEIKVFSATHS